MWPIRVLSELSRTPIPINTHKRLSGGLVTISRQTKRSLYWAQTLTGALQTYSPSLQPIDSAAAVHRSNGGRSPDMVVKVVGLNTSANMRTDTTTCRVTLAPISRCRTSRWLQRHSGEPERPRAPNTTSDVDCRVVSGFNAKHLNTDVLSRLRHTTGNRLAHPMWVKEINSDQ